MKDMQGEAAPGQGTAAEEQPARVTGLEDIIASSGISPRLWRLYSHFWLVCLIFPIIYLARTPLATVPLLVALAGLAIFVTAYLWVMRPYPLSDKGRNMLGSRSSSLLMVGITLLVIFLSLAYGSAFLWLFLGVSAMTGIVLPARQAFWVVTGLTLLTLGVSVIASDGIGGIDWLHVLPLVLLVRGLGLDMTGLHRLAGALWELNAARKELARQQVVEERLRMARDLHDLLGRTLSLITLKSELTRRLIEKDPMRAAQEVAEMERVARQALREVREAIAGYRQQTLASELDGARQILEAAGIACGIEHAPEEFPSRLDVALAWTVREGVTNVIRHSRAKKCLIQIGRQGGVVWAEVINDGYLGPDTLVSEPGTGLSGLGERIAAEGGIIDAGPYDFGNKPGFRLRVELPIRGNLAQSERMLR